MWETQAFEVVLELLAPRPPAAPEPGIVEAGVPAENVTLVDQSPHQLEKARKKPQLKDCTIEEGDAENLRFETNTFDRYVSCGSIEYWPDPQRGIVEAFR